MITPGTDNIELDFLVTVKRKSCIGSKRFPGPLQVLSYASDPQAEIITLLLTLSIATVQSRVAYFKAYMVSIVV